MNKKSVLTSLKRIEKEVRTLIDAMEGAPLPVVGTCPWCKKPIHEGEKITRGVHFTPCYNFARDRVKAGETTWDQLEKEGKTMPKETPGRKPMSITEHQEHYANEVREVIEQRRSRKK